MEKNEKLVSFHLRQDNHQPMDQISFKKHSQLDFSFENTGKVWQKLQADWKDVVIINKASFKQSPCRPSQMHTKSGVKQHGEAFGDKLKSNVSLSLTLILIETACLF